MFFVCLGARFDRMWMEGMKESMGGSRGREEVFGGTRVRKRLRREGSEIEGARMKVMRETEEEEGSFLFS